MRAVSFRHRVEYLALRLAECELLKLSPERALKFTEGFGALAYRLLEGRSRTGRENLQHAFPEASPGEIDALLKDGILIRDVSSYPMLGQALRVSVSTPEDNSRFLDSLAKAVRILREEQGS